MYFSDSVSDCARMDVMILISNCDRAEINTGVSNGFDRIKQAAFRMIRDMSPCIRSDLIQVSIGTYNDIFSSIVDLRSDNDESALLTIVSNLSQRIG